MQLKSLEKKTLSTKPKFLTIIENKSITITNVIFFGHIKTRNMAVSLQFWCGNGWHNFDMLKHWPQTNVDKSTKRGKILIGQSFSISKWSYNRIKLQGGGVNQGCRDNVYMCELDPETRYRDKWLCNDFLCYFINYFNIIYTKQMILKI